MGNNFIKDTIPFNVGLFVSDYCTEVSNITSPKSFSIKKVTNTFANNFVFNHHYLHRKLYIARNVSYGLFANEFCVGVCMFGYPVWRTYPGIVPPHDPSECPELLRLSTMGGIPKNSESYFVGRCIRLMVNDWKAESGSAPICITSFCDNAMGFDGSLYKALNFNFHKKLIGRPSNPGEAHGKWGSNKFIQKSEKTMYVYWYEKRKTKIGNMGIDKR